VSVNVRVPTILRTYTGGASEVTAEGDTLGAILEDLDRRAILRRTATGHVPGPRAASLGRAAEGAT